MHSNTLKKYINFKTYSDERMFYNFLEEYQKGNYKVLILAGGAASGKSFVTEMFRRYFNTLGLSRCPIICHVGVNCASADYSVFGSHGCTVVNLKRIEDPDFKAWERLENDLCAIQKELRDSI